MAHTDRDNAKWFWRNHFQNECTWVIRAYRDHLPADCWCRHRNQWSPTDELWINPYRREIGIPSAWSRDQRRIERGKLRDQIKRARAGNMDWDDMPSGEGKMYRRPYFW